MLLIGAGELYCFGNNRSGALGLAGHDNEGPPIVESTPKVSQLSFPLDYTISIYGAAEFDIVISSGFAIKYTYLWWALRTRTVNCTARLNVLLVDGAYQQSINNTVGAPLRCHNKHNDID